MTAVAGIYRGVCVDTADPDRLGRIRVQVPQLLGSSASGWAFPAWSLHDLTVWPEDRLPRPGQGVWVLFEGPDSLTWISVFGPQEYSQQFLDEELANYETTTSLRLPTLVPGLSVTLIGRVLAVAGSPEGAEVQLQRGPTQDGPWTPEGAPALTQRSGTWTVSYQPEEAHLEDWFRAVFAGQEPYSPSVSDPVQSEEGTTDTELSLVTPAPSGVAWQRPTLFSGFLLTNNLPLPDRPVVLLVRPKGATNWTAAGIATSTANGSWNIAWTRQGTAYSGETEVSAYFAGGDGYRASFAPEPPMLLPPVIVDTTLTMDPVVLVHGEQATATGLLTSAHGAPTPNPTVTVSVRRPSALEGPQQAIQTVNAVLVPDGDTDLRWTAQWVADSVSADITASFPGAWVYRPTSVREQVLQSRAVAPQGMQLPSTLSLGVPFDVTATIRDVHGSPVEVGSAVLQRRPDGGPWADLGDPEPVGQGGAWIAAKRVPPATGISEWRVRYIDNPDSGLLEGFGAAVRRDVLPASPVLSSGTLTHTSATFSWGSVPGATEYEVLRNGSPVATIAETTYTDSGLSNSATYTYTVRATDGAVTGPSSAGLIASTGRPQVRKQGSFEREEWISSSGTYRSDLGRWVQDGDYAGANYGDIIQGYYSNSSAMNFGVWNYNGAGFRSFVANTYGHDVLNALQWNRTRLYMHRSDSAFTSEGRATPIYIYVTDAVPRVTGAPILAGSGDNIGSWNRAAAGVGNYAKTVDIPYPWWGRHVLMNEPLTGLNNRPTRGFAMYQNSSANYSRYLGRRTDDTIAAKLTVNCSWDFISVAYVAPAWSWT